jgi:predicted alpha/beta superfamily hydrolase
LTSPRAGCSGDWRTQGSDRAPITCGHYAVLCSQVLGEARRLLVYLPQGYDDGSEPYPALIHLDGDKEVFCQTAMATWYLAHMAERIPSHIVVAIEHTDRARDTALGAGAERFLQFVAAELLPFTAANYRTSGSHILCGQSASSVFACYAFLKQPRLFDACVLSSFGLSDRAYAFFTRDLLPTLSLAGLQERALFAANGQVDPYDPSGARASDGLRFLDALAHVAGNSIVQRHETYGDEGHVPYPSLYDGLKWIYSLSRTVSTEGAQ